MNHILLWLLAVHISSISMPTISDIKEQIISFNHSFVNEVPPIMMPLTEIRTMLHTQASTLNEQVIDKVLTTLKCANAYNVDRNNILTIIDYSLPSNEKRLWVFDLKEKKLLYHTYVSHGITSGTLATNFFSNKFNSKASSIGVYKTEQAYYGREGLSLRLDGLDRSFNDNASNRSVVMHGGWYVEEPFIKRYGRPGRSWGCPALPLGLYQPIINTIKDKSLLVAYYPSDNWFGKSRFLNCEKNSTSSVMPSGGQEALKPIDNTQTRDAVLFANSTNGVKHADDNPIVVMSADNYEHIFHTQPPLERMLRRQINKAEYIALSTNEFRNLAEHSNANNKTILNTIYFVVPVIIMVRGYAETQMRIVNMGKIKEIRCTGGSKNDSGKSYTVSFETRPSINLTVTNRFIRWLGL